LAPNTPIRSTINTYPGHALAGTVTYSTSMQYNCTSGAILSLVAGAPGDLAAIPALSDLGLAATSLLLAIAGIVAMRRYAAARSS
jgi:hypothetical protein